MRSSSEIAFRGILAFSTSSTLFSVSLLQLFFGFLRVSLCRFDEGRLAMSNGITRDFDEECLPSFLVFGVVGSIANFVLTYQRNQGRNFTLANKCLSKLKLGGSTIETSSSPTRWLVPQHVEIWSQLDFALE